METRCEFGDCSALAWRVLFWGPKKTAPARAACHRHEGETDLSLFRGDLPTTHDSKPADVGLTAEEGS